MTGAERVDQPFDAFNVATGDYVTVTEIAELAVEVLGLEPGSTRFDYTGGDRGWKGDVPDRSAQQRDRSVRWAGRTSGPVARPCATR